METPYGRLHTHIQFSNVYFKKLQISTILILPASNPKFSGWTDLPISLQDTLWGLFAWLTFNMKVEAQKLLTLDYLYDYQKKNGIPKIPKS